MSNEYKIRNLVSTLYDTQKLRIAAGNRIVASFNAQMGQKPQSSQKEMDKEVEKKINILRNEHRRITDAYIDATTNGKSKTIAKIITEFGDKKLSEIKDKFDYDLVDSYVKLLEIEDQQTKVLTNEVKKHYLWNSFFKDVKGCGPLMAAVCLAYFDVHKARHVSSFWKYAGVDTVTYQNEKGEVVTEGRARKHAKYTITTYVDKETGELKEKNSLGYNPTLKTKLVGVLGECMLKAGIRSTKDANGKVIVNEDGERMRMALPDAKYAQCYLDYYNRLNQRPDTKDYKDIRKHRMANRYMIKQFLRDLWITWRAAEGYELSLPYEVDKLGMKPHKYNEAHAIAAGYKC